MLQISENAGKLIRKMTAKNGIPEGGLYWPGLTSVLQPVHRMGASGCRALLEVMQNPDLERTADVQYGVELIPRESTAEVKGVK
jgi:DNA-binding LacI/PurR family transcriptional regulator